MKAALPALLMLFALFGLLLVRRLSLKARMIFDVACLIAFSTLLYVRGQPPILAANSLPVGAEGWSIQILAIAWWLVSARVTVVTSMLILGHDKRSREARLFSDLLSACIYLGAGLIILNSVLDLPVKGLLATSGLIAIVIGLALQNTLADVFSGIAVGIEQPFGVGDRVSIGDNGEGLIVQLNWRSVRLQTDGDDVVTIPNSVVAKAQIINRSVPSTRRATSVEILCPAHAPPEMVMTLLRHALMLSPAILTSPAPTPTLKRLGIKTNSYAIAFTVRDTGGIGGAKSGLLQQIRRQFHFAGLLQLPGASPSLPTAGLLPPVATLRGLQLLESLDDGQIEQLASQLTTVHLSSGETLFVQDEVNATLFIIAAGVFEVVRTKEDHLPSILGRISAGEYIGEISLLTGVPHGATATALTPSVVYQLSRAAIDPLMARNAELASAFDQSIRRGLELLNRDPAACSAQPAMAPGALLSRIRGFFHFGSA